LLAASAACADADKPPNIIWIMADDLGWDEWFGAQGTGATF